MSLEAAIYARLAAAPSLLLEGRQVPVRPTHLPQAEASPAIRYERVGTSRAHHMGGDQGMVSARVQIDAYGDDFNKARALSELVRALLQDWSGGVVDACYLENEIEDYDRDAKAARVMLEFQMWYREAVA